MGKKKEKEKAKVKISKHDKFNQDKSISSLISINTQLEYAREQRLNNRLSRGLKQRIYLLSSQQDFDSIKKFKTGLFINEEKNKDKTTTYHNSSKCNKKAIEHETIRPNANLLGPMGLVPCEDCCEEVIDWLLEIHGSTGNTYKVKANLEKITCSCVDFNKNKNCCKHILQVFFKVLGHQVDLDQNQDKFILSSDDLRQVQTSLTTKFIQEQKRMDEPLETTDTRQNKEDNCPVCQDFLGEEPLSMCAMHCKQAFHSDCIKLWLGRSELCPMCRNKLIIKTIIIKDAQDGDKE